MDEDKPEINGLHLHAFELMWGSSAVNDINTEFIKESPLIAAITLF